jgi:tetratricopeptide (TPR) repeat protein
VEHVLRACRDADHSLRVLDAPAAEMAWPLLDPNEVPIDPADDLQPGTTVGSYTIERRIGRGGMGIVYLARDERLDRSVALKLLPAWLGMSEAAERRFVQEAKAASRRDHPNIETIYEIGEAPDGRLFIAMAYYEGETLRERIARGALDLHAVLDLGRQIADGLGAAHAHGIVHRDIKPSNLIVTPDGVAKILDFGAATMASDRRTDAGGALGTVAYMSPEQTRGDHVDPRTDIWSLGVVLYEMLAGSRPFQALRRDAVIRRIRNDDPAPLGDLRPGVPEPFARVVHRCLAKDPGARYPDGAELANELRGILERGDTGARGARSPPELAGRMARPSTRATAAAAGLALLIAGLAIVRSSRSPGEPEVAGATAALAVLPFTPAVEDSVLRRLGRELAVTLSASLDGAGGVRTTEALTILAEVTEDQDVTLEGRADLAERLGARNFIHGTLVRANGGVRLELGLFDAADGRPLARATATAPLDDIGALTDSAALAILRRIGAGGDDPAPNATAITTRSLPALRAYLEGELAFAGAEFDDAVRAYERAFRADSSFLLAYWKSVYPRIYETSRPDSAVMARIYAERDRLPDPDRLLVEAYTAETLGVRLATLRGATRRFSGSWRVWYHYADALVHHGPHVGSTYGDARAALERVVSLNPHWAEAWWHLLWIGLLQRDAPLADRSLERLEAFESPNAFLFNPDNMAFFRALHGALRADGEFSEIVTERLAQVALRVTPRVSPGVIATSTLTYGFPKAQLQQADALLRERPPPAMVESLWRGKAFSWATRGAWDSALVATDQWVQRSDDPQAALRGYGLSALGAWLGALPREDAERLRPGPSGAPALRSPDAAAERAWLDGILAYAAGEPSGIAAARAEVTRTGARYAGILERSLDAFHRHAVGDHDEAARSLAALEWDIAEHGIDPSAADSHPYLSPIHRLAAGRWILETGDTLQAARLLTWHEAHPGSVPTRIVEPLALYERARLEEARGLLREAREHYRGFVERYDLPPPHHRALVEQARSALARLSDDASIGAH